MAMGEFRYVTTYVYQTGSNNSSHTNANPIIAELPFTGVNFTSQLNSYGTFNGHVLLSGAADLNAYEGTTPGRTILWVLYTDPFTLTSVPVWSGVIWAREYDSTEQTLHISAQEMPSLYAKRLISTTKDYSTGTGFDPIYIATNLMQYAESLTYGNTGLDYDTGTTNLKTKKKYNGYELKPVYQAIKDLSANYFDFRIAPYVRDGKLVNVFECKAPLGTLYTATSPLGIVLEFPGNLVGYKFPEDASGAANKLYGIGAAGTNTQTVAIAKDTIKNTQDHFPLLEATANYSDVGDNALLIDLTKGQISAISYPPTTVEVALPPYVDPYYPQYKVGDQVSLRIKDAYFPSGVYFGGGTPNDPMRIMAISVNPGENGPSRITLTLTRNLATGVE